MNRNQKIFILALTIPLLLYSIPYAYAATSTSTYIVATYVAGTSLPSSTIVGTAYFASCGSGDVATGGGYFLSNPGFIVFQSQPHSNTPPYTTPDSWVVSISNHNNEPTSGNSADVYVVCQTPVTVAGIGIPEFSSLYGAILIAAIAYFGLSILRTKRTANPSIAVLK